MTDWNLLRLQATYQQSTTNSISHNELGTVLESHTFPVTTNHSESSRTSLANCDSRYVEGNPQPGGTVSPFTEKRPSFETGRFIVAPLSPVEARNLLAILLQDEALASRVQWLTEKSQDGALREAFGIELQSASGQIKVWGIIAREQRMQIGAIIARNSLEGIDVEVLVASQFWDDEVADETGEPVVEWLANTSEVIQDFPAVLH